MKMRPPQTPLKEGLRNPKELRASKDLKYYL
jgi:hypothetical protein